MRKQNNWLKVAMELAAMMRDLRKAEQHVKNQKALIRRFLHLHGCRRFVPWGTARSAKNKRPASAWLGLSHERADNERAVQDLQQHERLDAVNELATLLNGRGNKHDKCAVGQPAKILRCNGKQLVG